MLDTQKGTTKFSTILAGVGRWRPMLISDRMMPTTSAILRVFRSVVGANHSRNASPSVDHPARCALVLHPARARP